MSAPRLPHLLLVALCLGLLGCPETGRGEDDDDAADDDDSGDDDDATSDDDDASSDDDDATSDDDDATSDDDDATGDDDDATSDDDDAANDDDATSDDDDDATGDDDDATGDDDDATVDPCPTTTSICVGGSCILSVDPSVMPISGLLLWDGAAIPASSDNRWEFVFENTEGRVRTVPRDASAGATNTYAIPMAWGTHDVFFRWTSTASPASSAWPDPIHGLVPVATAVPPGAGALDVTPDPARVTGLLLWDGAPIPAGADNQWEFLFVDVATENELTVPRDAGSGPVSTYDIPMVPGTYDVYFTWTETAAPGTAGWPDPVFGRIPVATSFTVGSTGAALNVDIDPVRVTGLLQWDGAAIPASSGNQWDLVFEPIGGGPALSVPRSASDGPVSTYDVPMLPGSYDVHFAWVQSSASGTTSWPDPIFGNLEVATAFTVPAGGGSLNITPDPVRVTGLLSWDGAPIPQSGSNTWRVTFTNPANDQLLWIPRDASDGDVSTFDVPMLPGTYEVGFSWVSAVPWGQAGTPDPVFGDLLIAPTYVVPSGGGTLNITPDPVRLTGALGWEGAPIAASSDNQWAIVLTPSGGGASLEVRRDAAAGPAAVYDIPAFPGTWDIVFRWLNTAAPASSAWPDPIFGDLGLGSVTIPAGGGTVNIEPDPLPMTGPVEWDGGPVPASADNQWDVVWTDPYTGNTLWVPRDASGGAAVGWVTIPVWPGVWDLDMRWTGAADPATAGWPDPVYGLLDVWACQSVP